MSKRNAPNGSCERHCNLGIKHAAPGQYIARAARCFPQRRGGRVLHRNSLGDKTHNLTAVHLWLHSI